MNRFKKELRKKGVKLECDYPWMPFELIGHTLEAIIVNTEMCTVTSVTTSITLVDYYNRSMELDNQEWL